VFVPPAPGDAGCALGAALYTDRIYFRNADRDVPDHPLWGPTVDGHALGRAAREDGQSVEDLDEATLLERVTKALADGRIVGWMDGGCEFGPRALGHRSLLAAPHPAEMRDRLNRDIKRREEFRPFAPVVPIEWADRFFDLPPGALHVGRLRCSSGVASSTRGRHARRWHGARPGRRPRDGAAASRTGRSVRPPNRRSGAAEHLVQHRRRADRHARARGLPDVSPLRHRRPGSRVNRGIETGDADHITEGVRDMVLKQRSGLHRRLIMIGSASGSIGDLARGLWHDESGRRWLLALAVFLCIFGVILILATTVEALAPFIYAIF